jgi:hypothetical protein
VDNSGYPPVVDKQPAKKRDEKGRIATRRVRDAEVSVEE